MTGNSLLLIEKTFVIFSMVTTYKEYTMQTQTFNAQASNQKPNFLHVVLVSIVGSLILFSGFMISLFLLAVSAIIFPFVAFRIWRLQRQYQKNVMSAQTANADKGVVIEAEYIVVDESLDNEYSDNK